MLQARDLVPHFTVAAIDGARVAYTDIWQRRILLLLCVPAGSASSTAYVDGVSRRVAEARLDDAACVATSDPVEGIPCPGVLVADRWGEVEFVAGAADVRGLPGGDELVEWIRYVRIRCPECEGETR